MQAVLVMFRSDGERRSFSITREVTVVGRREDCDLRIPLHEVSRKHCRLINEPEQLRIEDLGSSNGTYVNAQRIERDAVLQAGDSVQIGPVVFVLQVDGHPADEDLNPVMADLAAGAMAGGAMVGGEMSADMLGNDSMAGAGVGGPAVGGTGDDLDMLAGENFDDLPPLSLGDDELLPDPDAPLGGGRSQQSDGLSLNLADLDDEPITGDALAEAVEHQAPGELMGTESRHAGAPIPLDDEPLSLADDLSDQPLGLTPDGHLPIDEQNPFDQNDQPPIALADDEAIGGPDDLLIELDDPSAK